MGRRGGREEEGERRRGGEEEVGRKGEGEKEVITHQKQQKFALYLG